MKNLFLQFALFILFLCCTTQNVNAQYVTIPDPNFVAWLNANGYAGCMNGNMMDTTCGAVVNATSVDCSTIGISDLSGIQYFDNLDTLLCWNNLLSNLPPLPNSLTVLHCYVNQIDSLPSLPISLIDLTCSSNLLTSLPVLPSTLIILACGGNQLTFLPALPNSITSLECSQSLLTYLPALPNSLTNLYCAYNQLTTFPALPNLLRALYCNNNQLTSLPALPNSLINLTCYSNKLANLPALSDSLTDLWCSVNQLSSIPPLPTKLTNLKCSRNQLTNLPALPNLLANLECGYNQLSSLPALPNSLIYLFCDSNQLTSLPPLPNSVTNFYCNNNLLSTLPNLPNSLIYLQCTANQLTNLPSLPNTLFDLRCDFNQLTSLPSLPNSLFVIHCNNNQLTSLPELPDYLSFFYLYDNPNLLCLPKLKKIYDFEFANTGIQCLPNFGKITFSNPLISSLPLCDLFNTNSCQAFWNVSGNIYNDTNNNCISNSNEPKYSNIKLNLYKNGNLEQSTFTISNGNYSFDTDTGLYIIEIDTSNNPILVNCPTTFSDTAYLANNDTMRDNKNFASGCKPGFDVGVSTVVRDSGIFRPANFANVKILSGDVTNHYGLHCAAGVSGVVQVIINGPATYIGAVNGALTPTINSDTLIYTIADFGLVDFDNDFQIQVQTDTTAQLGQQVCFTVNVTPTVGDNNIANNTLTHCFTVVNSYDPNDKSVSPVSGLSINDKKLTYTIRFQNTGNAPAQHIYVMDTLDAALNASTFELLAYSHQPQVQLIGNILRFNFPNINLPDSVNDEPNSHGYIQFSIKLKDSLALGTIIKNTSYIYFDFNPPVQTNTTSNTIIGTGFNYINSSSDISVYPNPTTNSITITTKNIGNNSIATLYDMQGRELKTQKLNTQQTQMNLQGLSIGNYLLKVVDGENLVGVKRVVKMK